MELGWREGGVAGEEGGRITHHECGIDDEARTKPFR